MSSRVVDVRYDTYHGERRGRVAAIWSLARFGALTALGARRGWRAKLIPIFLIAIAYVPAIVVLGLRALAPPALVDRLPETLIPYPVYFFEIGLDVIVFAALLGPELLCPDRRDRVLSLYLSTAVSRTEYVLGRLLGALLPLTLVTVVPVFVLFVGNVVFATSPLAYLRDHWVDGPRIVAAGLVLSLYFALLALAVASLTSRRAFAMGGYVALMLVSQLASGFLRFGVSTGPWALLLALGRVPLVAIRDLFGPAYSFTGDVAIGWYWAATAAAAAIALLVYLARYLRTRDV